MSNDKNSPPQENNGLIGVKYSKPPPPLRYPPGYEPPIFYEKEDVENERQLQNALIQSKQMAAEAAELLPLANQAFKIHGNYVLDANSRANELLKAKEKGSVWDRLSFVTQLTLVGLVALQIIRGGKWVVEWVWEKVSEVDARQKREELLARFQEAWERRHAREFQIRDGLDDDEVL